MGQTFEKCSVFEVLLLFWRTFLTCFSFLWILSVGTWSKFFFDFLMTLFTFNLSALVQKPSLENADSSLYKNNLLHLNFFLSSVLGNFQQPLHKWIRLSMTATARSNVAQKKFPPRGNTIFAVFDGWRLFLIVSILKAVHSFLCQLRLVNLRKVENSEKAFPLTKQTTSNSNFSATFHCLSKLLLRRFSSKKLSGNWTFILQFYNIFVWLACCMN